MERLTKEFLVKEYILNKKSMRKIEEEFGIDRRRIARNIKKLKIKQRTHSEATSITNARWKKEVRVINKTYFCIDCGKKIHWSSALYGNKRCMKCAQIERRKNSLYNKKYYCIDCNKEIHCHTAISGGHRCSSCATKEQMKNPENHYNWQGGKSFEPYPLGWTRTYKEQIRYRDGYKCQICGCHEVECKNKLHVHHIDYNKSNLKEENLISLCNSCHVKTNYNREKWEKYFDKIMRRN